MLYQTDNGNVNVSVTYHNETFWLTQKAIAELFDVNIPAISKHLTNGKKYKTQYYNLFAV